MEWLENQGLFLKCFVGLLKRRLTVSSILIDVPDDILLEAKISKRKFCQYRPAF